MKSERLLKEIIATQLMYAIHLQQLANRPAIKEEKIETSDELPKQYKKTNRRVKKGKRQL